MLIQILAPHFVAGLTLEKDKVTKAAPIIKYMIDWSEEAVKNYCESKRWIVQSCEKTNEKRTTLYADGSCYHKSREGAYAVVVYGKDGTEQASYKENISDTTNNVMELRGLYCALAHCIAYGKEQAPFEIYCDSKYVVMGYNVWMEQWKQTNWKKQKLKNWNYWDLMYEMKRQIVQLKIPVEVKWVKGHAESHGNNRVDQLATYKKR